jgi:ribosome maturation factor RimP
MKKGTVAQIVKNLVTPFLDEQEFELVDVEFIKEGPHRYLRLFIDKEGGVSLDDCQLVSVFLNKELDRLDPIEENYYLEVSSPGIERSLKKDTDFERFKGNKVQAKLYKTINGQKIITGELEGLEDNCILIKNEISGDVVSIPKEMAAQVKLIAEI